MEAKTGRKKKAPIPQFISKEDILNITTTGAFIGNRRLTLTERDALKVDARHFGESFLWQMMRREIHYVAYLQATNKAQTQEDINYANAMYKNLEVLEEFIKSCRTL